jgi:hypothetical protein
MAEGFAAAYMHICARDSAHPVRLSIELIPRLNRRSVLRAKDASVLEVHFRYLLSKTEAGPLLEGIKVGVLCELMVILQKDRSLRTITVVHEGMGAFRTSSGAYKLILIDLISSCHKKYQA